MEYGKNMKLIRESKNLSQTKVAKQTGLNQQMISHWENEKGLPNIHFCAILADYYGISIDELVGHEIKKNW